MGLWSALKNWWAPPIQIPVEDMRPKPQFVPSPFEGNVDPTAALEMMARAFSGQTDETQVFNPFDPRRLKPAPGVGPKGGVALAMDDAAIGGVAAWGADGLYGTLGGREGFIGFPQLAIMSQRPEYRSPVEIIATEATREWIKFHGAGDADKADKIKELEEAMRLFEVQALMRQVSELDGIFGRSHIYVDINDSWNDPKELMKPIGNGKDGASKAKIAKGSLKFFQTVEPLWAWPVSYASDNPLSPRWYRPDEWYVMSNQVDKTRLLTFISRPVPDLLKPAYMFGGQSLIQMMIPVVENWLSTRKCVGEIIKKYSMIVWKANITEAINTGNAGKLGQRVKFFQQFRNNNGMLLMDTSEDMLNISVPLGGLELLQAQAQEHMASLPRIPLIKLAGIQPAGLNASSEGELRAFDENIHSYQEAFFRPNLTVVINIIQCHIWGAVDEKITYSFNPITTLSDEQKASLRRTDSETDEINLRNRGVSREEVRKRLAADPTTPYAGLDAKSVPNLPGEDAAEAVKNYMQGIVGAFSEALIDKPTALKMIKQFSESIGADIVIDDAMISEAENEPPTPSADDLKAQAALVKAHADADKPNESPDPQQKEAA